jgi:hypothetical protein
MLRVALVADFEPLALIAVGSNCVRDFGLFHMRKISTWLNEG